MLLPLAPVLLGPTSRVRVASTVRPSFFLSAPEMAPRMVWCCHPVAAAICSTVAPSGRLSISIISACLVPARGVGFAAGSRRCRGLAVVAFALPLAGLVFAGFVAPLASLAGAGASAALSASADVGAVSAAARLVVVRLDADRGHALAGDDHPFGSAVAAERPGSGPGCGGCPSPC